MKSAGAVVIELAWQVLNQLSAKDTATALRGGGISRAIQCVFYPPDDKGGLPPMGDPISDDPQLVLRAQFELLKSVSFIQSLRRQNVHAEMIVGPSCLLLGVPNSLDWNQRKQRILAFYMGIGQQLVDANVKVAIELLRSEEDMVIETRERWIDLLDFLNAQFAEKFGPAALAIFGAHYDTHHIQSRQWDQVETINMLGRRIIHLHVNGTLRRPAGGEGDEMEWGKIISALESATQGRVIAAINEPFCALVRKECPPLGVGLPEPVEEPAGMRKTRETLVTHGAKLVNA